MFRICLINLHKQLMTLTIQIYYCEFLVDHCNVYFCFTEITNRTIINYSSSVTFINMTLMCACMIERTSVIERRDDHVSACGMV